MKKVQIDKASSNTSVPRKGVYITVTQCGVGRMDCEQSPEYILGLHTEGLNTCLGFVIIGHEEKKISLIHTAMEADEKAIIRECEAVNYPCSIYPIKGGVYANPKMEQFRKTQTTLMHRLQSSIADLPITLDERYFNPPSSSVCVDRSGVIYINEKNLSLEKSPQVQLRLAINMINVYTKLSKFHPLDIQYDVSTWTSLPRLSERSMGIVSTFANQPGNLQTNNPDLIQKVKIYNSHVETAVSREISLSTMNVHIGNVQEQLLISNDIVLRTQYPYYQSHPSAPKALIHFKVLLSKHRVIISSLVEKLGKQPAGSVMHDFSKWTFHHTFVGSLATAAFGLGECSESMVKLAENLITEQGRVDLMFVSFNFTQAKNGMETTHFFLVANIKSMPPQISPKMNFHKFLTCLPKQAVIGDAFLGVSYSPDKCPQVVRDYFSAYGESTALSMVYHIYNFSLNLLGGYVGKAAYIVRQAKAQGEAPFAQAYSYKDKHNLSHDSILIQRLNENTGIHFKGYKDKRHYVDAVGKLHSKKQLQEAISLQGLLRGANITFFQQGDKGKQGVVIEHLNDPKIAQSVQSLLSRQ